MIYEENVSLDFLNRLLLKTTYTKKINLNFIYIYNKKKKNMPKEKEPLLSKQSTEKNLYQCYTTPTDLLSSQQECGGDVKTPEEVEIENQKKIIKDLKIENVLLICGILVIVITEFILISKYLYLAFHDDLLILTHNNNKRPNYPIVIFDDYSKYSHIKLPESFSIYENIPAPMPWWRA